MCYYKIVNIASIVLLSCLQSCSFSDDPPPAPPPLPLLIQRAKPVAVTPATCGTLTTLPDGAVNPPFTLDLPRPQHLTSNHLDLTDHLATLEQEAMARHGKLQAKRYLNTTWCSKDAKDAPCKKQGNPRLPTVEEELSVVSVGLERSSSVLVHRN